MTEHLMENEEDVDMTVATSTVKDLWCQLKQEESQVNNGIFRNQAHRRRATYDNLVECHEPRKMRIPDIPPVHKNIHEQGTLEEAEESGDMIDEFAVYVSPSISSNANKIFSYRIIVLQTDLFWGYMQ
ncbi:hypothetical protein JTB14_014053 [Gonioctena quinquepunctata]|nr:hypothetical protein JTB14_014053 [Gonioctena quinquepunctata]